MINGMHQIRSKDFPGSRSAPRLSCCSVHFGASCVGALEDVFAAAQFRSLSAIRKKRPLPREGRHFPRTSTWGIHWGNMAAIFWLSKSNMLNMILGSSESKLQDFRVPKFLWRQLSKDSTNWATSNQVSDFVIGWGKVPLAKVETMTESSAKVPFSWNASKPTAKVTNDG